MPKSSSTIETTSGEQLQGHVDASSSANPCDSSTQQHTDPKSDEEQDEYTSASSQKPPRPGIKSVRKKRKRTEQARRKEEREKLAEKNRKKRVNFSLYQFIKEEIFHLRKNRQIRKYKPKKVERGPVFKPFKRPTLPPQKKTFCMRPKKKKKKPSMLKHETSAVEDEMFQMRMQNRFKKHPKRKMEIAHPKVSPPSTRSSSSRSAKVHSRRSDRLLHDALLVLAQEEGITDEECADLYERETMMLNLHPSNEHSKNVQSLRKQLVHGLKKLSESNPPSDACFQSESSNAAKKVDTKKAIKRSNKITDTSKKIPPSNDAKDISKKRELKKQRRSK